MKTGLTWLLKACLAGVTALVILSLLSLFYNYTGIHQPNPTGATDYIWEPNNWMVDIREGFAVWRFDANGFINWQPDYDRPVTNLLMGDSQAQAAHVMGTDNLAARLNVLCPEQYTYNIAISSHGLYTCVKNLEDAIREFEPTSTVMIDAVSIEMDIDSMQRVLDDTYPTLPSYNTGLVAKLQKWFPGLKLVYKQLEQWASQAAAGAGQDTTAKSVPAKEYEDTLDAFLKKAADTAAAHGIRLIIFYIPPVSVSETGDIVCASDPDMLAAFACACAQNGIRFVDMTEAFGELYKNEYRMPYGFINTQVGKGHLNKYGYQVIAGELAETLRDL